MTYLLHKKVTLIGYITDIMIVTNTSLTTARIRALNAVFDEGNFSSAARVLGISQPAVSQAIKDFERAFNVLFFVRRGGQMVPTDICMKLAPLTNEMVQLEGSILQLLTKQTCIETGVLRVGIGNLLPGMALINTFQKCFPKIQVQAEYAIYSDTLEAVLNSQVDIGILPNVPNDGRFVRKTCLTQDLVALIPLGHMLAQSMEVSVKELIGETMIFQKKGSATQKVVDAAFKKANLSPHASLVLEKGSEVYEAVVNGLGIGFMWCHSTSRQDGARRIPITEIDTTYDEVVFRRSDTVNPIVNLFFSTIEFNLHTK